MKKKSLLFLLTLLLVVTSCVFVACNEQGGDSEKLASSDIISTDFEDKKAEPPAEPFDFEEYMTDMGDANFPFEEVTESKAEYYTNITTTEILDYLDKYSAADSGWTKVDETIFVKGLTIVFIVYDEDTGDLQITDVTVTESFAKELSGEGDDDSVSYNYDITQPSKTEYAPGELLDLTGFQIVRVGSDNSSVILVEGTDYTIDKTAFDTTLEAGSTRKEIHIPFETIVGNFSGTITLSVIKPDDKDFTGADFDNANKTYDGVAISATFTPPTDVSGYIVEYSYSESLGEEGWTEWSLENPSFTDPCYYNVKARITKDGYSEQTLYAVVSIRVATFANESDLKNELMIGYYGEYDGEAHGGTLNSEVELPEGATIEYSVDDDVVYSATAPTFTEVGEPRVHYRVTKKGYNTVYGSYLVSISKKDIPGITIAYLNGEEYIPNMCYAEVTVMQGETEFVLRYSLDPLKPLADIYELDGIDGADVVKYSTDDGVTWTTTAPSATSSGQVKMKVIRGTTAETNYDLIVVINYITNTPVEFEDCGLEVKLLQPFNGQNYSSSEDSSVAPFSPYVNGNTEGSVILVRSSADDGETWTEWVSYGDNNYDANNEYSEAGTYKYEYKYYKTGAGLCEFARTFVVDP